LKVSILLEYEQDFWTNNERVYERGTATILK
jgi:hypothetical protein